MDTESIRLSYRPQRITVLFVGESAPASGKFFYKADPPVFREIRRAFSQHFGLQCEDKEFLDWFKARGCFLDDLVHTPINDKVSDARKAARSKGVESLASRIAEYRPKTIIAIMKTIDPYVKDALRKSGVSATYHCVSFPGNGRQREFQDEMSKLLPNLPISQQPSGG
jgi:hypothetical protein